MGIYRGMKLIVDAQGGMKRRKGKEFLFSRAFDFY
jgi:hypothetical protein